MTRRLAAHAVLPTLALVAALAVVPGRAGLLLHVYALVLGAVAMVVLLAALRRAHPSARVSPFERALRREPAVHARLAELTRLEREVELAHGSEYDFHFRLRPALRETARGLLAARRGVDLDANADGARAILGDSVYDLVRPDRPPPADNRAPGFAEGELERVVEALEAV